MSVTHLTERNDRVSRDYVDHYPLLVRIALRKFGLAPDEAEALTHEVFVSYLIHLDCIREPRKWLIGAVCNASRLLIRQRARMIPVADVERLAARMRTTAPTAPATAASADLLKRLRPRNQAVLKRKYLEGFTNRELAAEFETTEGYAEQLVHDALREARTVSRVI